MSPSGEKPTARQFDWGPTADHSFDGVKEWGVYGFLVTLLAVCGWFLLDLEKAPPGGQEAPPAVPAPVPMTAAPARPLPAAIPQAAPTPVAAPADQGLPAFYVQLGAFGDEDSARLAQERAKAQGFVASLTAPGEQYEMYRLILGPYRDEGGAEKAARQLNELDFPCFVIESP